MDGSKIDLITILSLIVAVIAILKLRSVLGRRTSDDDARLNQKMRAQQEAEMQRERAASEKVVSLPRRERDDVASRPATPSATTTMADLEAKFMAAAGGNAGMQQALLALHQSDETFDPQHFMQGARQAYEMIVTAFAEGNRKVLKDLLSKDVFDGFAAAIGEREQRGEQIDQSFVGISKSDFVEVESKGNAAQITVKFVSQLISATRDRGGQVISGDPQRITEVTDIWTFARELKSRNPNWRLIATQSSN